jgi:hypothetical protein
MQFVERRGNGEDPGNGEDLGNGGNGGATPSLFR